MEKKEIRIDSEHSDLLLEVLEDALYQVALRMEEFKGGANGSGKTRA